jgi:hemerythrin-like domain-containing protein
MGKLQIALQQNVSAKEFADWRLGFLWQMRDFKNKLLKHFDLEEEGGFMGDVVAAAPHSEGKVRQLRNEHAQIILTLDDILACLKNIKYTESERLKAIRENIDELVANLRQHEEDEHRLMQRTYYREYGGPA